jgi:signal transduction histidine kinase
MIPDRLADCSLLLIDDEEANLDLLEGLLASSGYRRFTRVSDPREALAAFDEVGPDLVLLDLHMPHLSGYEVLAEIRSRGSADEYLPVLVLTADVTSEARDRALADGAHDFITKPFDAIEVLLRVRNLLETRVLHIQQRAARIRAEEAESHARVLAEGSRLLGASLDSETGLAQMARLLTPRFAGSTAFLLMEGDAYRVVGLAEAERGGGAFGQRLDPSAEPLASALEAASPSRIALAGEETLVAPMVTAARRIGALLATPPPTRTTLAACDVELLVDLADRTALALENAYLFADAQLASRSRERMLYVVAHDLRNPLAVIAMYSEMLLDLRTGGEDQYSADALNSIFKSALRMQEQIESLLDVSRMQTGTFSLRPGECRIEEVFAEAEMLLGPLATTRSIELTVAGRTVDPGATAILDVSRFQQVLSNLVGNAIKFTPDGGRVVLGWELCREELTVTVTDTGPGIAPDQLPHIFGAFWQAGHGDRRGLGLGLWIARAIVEAHGGKIWVDSEVGAGSTFRFVLPTVPPFRPLASDGMGSLTHDPTLATS